MSLDGALAQWSGPSVLEAAPAWATPHLEFTRHGLARKTQRGFQTGDVEFLMRHGKDIGDHAYLLMKRDADNLIRRCDRHIRRLRAWLAEPCPEDMARGCRETLRDLQATIHRAERLAGVKVVVIRGKILTAYDTSPRHQKWAVRWGRQAGA